jgi:CO dehydrogenase/acetyl-CoA synthase alpha subunit
LAKKIGQKAIGEAVSTLGAMDGGTVATGEGKTVSTIPIISGPVLKKCDIVFNPQKKFCYDGAVYDKCDGMEHGTRE